MGRAVLPPSLLSGLRWPSPGVYRLYCRAIGNLQENLHWDISPRNTATSSPVPVVGLCQHTPQKKTLRHSHVGLAQSPVGSVFLSFQPWCAQSFVFVCQEWCLCFPQSCEGSWSQIPLAFKIRFPGAFPAPWLHLPAGEPDVGPRTFTTVQGLLWCHCSLGCGSPTQKTQDLIL